MGKLLTAAVAASLSMFGTMMSTTNSMAQAEPFLGQLMVGGWNFCPRGWARADGQILSIAQNTALFSLLGTTYGGNGQTTFALPDLRGRAPIHNGQGPGLPSYDIGEVGGSTSFTLSVNQLPSHSHPVKATNVGSDKPGPLGKYLGLNADPMYHLGPPNVNMAADMVAPTGGNQPVSHRGPYLGLQWCIALEGIFPSRD